MVNLPFLYFLSISGFSIAHPLEPSFYAQTPLPIVLGSRLSLRAFPGRRPLVALCLGRGGGDSSLWIAFAVSCAKMRTTLQLKSLSLGILGFWWRFLGGGAEEECWSINRHPPKNPKLLARWLRGIFCLKERKCLFEMVTLTCLQIWEKESLHVAGLTQTGQSKKKTFCLLPHPQFIIKFFYPLMAMMSFTALPRTPVASRPPPPSPTRSSFCWVEPNACAHIWLKSL